MQMALVSQTWRVMGAEQSSDSEPGATGYVASMERGFRLVSSRRSLTVVPKVRLRHGK